MIRYTCADQNGLRERERRHVICLYEVISVYDLEIFVYMNTCMSCHVDYKGKPFGGISSLLFFGLLSVEGKAAE